MSTAPIVNISTLNKWYGDFHVLRDINLEVGKGERIVICGPSGSGKSTLIRCINALEEFQEGEIVVDGIELGPNLRRVDEVRREVGMVFQAHSWFTNTDVVDYFISNTVILTEDGAEVLTVTTPESLIIK